MRAKKAKALRRAGARIREARAWRHGRCRVCGRWRDVHRGVCGACAEDLATQNGAGSFIEAWGDVRLPRRKAG